VKTYDLVGWESSHPVPHEFHALDVLGEQFPWTLSQWQLLKFQNEKIFYQQDSKLVAFALYQLSPLEELAHLLKIVVVPELRGSGIAELFMRDQVATLRGAGFRRVYLEVALSNVVAQSFYKRLGFVELRRIKGYYQDGQMALTMELAI
jgi:ribosomal protein S18 acetylase RimI-like enzyme